MTSRSILDCLSRARDERAVWCLTCAGALLTSLACGGGSEEPGEPAALDGNGATAASRPDAGVTRNGMGMSGGGGSAASMSMAGSASMSEGIGGSALSIAGTGGNMSMLPSDGELEAASGETGVFVGMTAAHNAARAAEMRNPALPDLTWSEDLAAVAQDWANTLAQNCGTIMHRMPNKYGENIAEHGHMGGPPTMYTPAEAVADWVSEKACWSYGTIARTEVCDETCATMLHSNGCGHYTQVVWRDSQRVGCGYVSCQDGGFTDEIWVCNYDPPGNYIGEAPY